MTPYATWSSSLDARGLALDGDDVWVATSGGLDRYRGETRERRHYAVADGLDTLDVRDVSVDGGRVGVRTATGHCVLAAMPDRFTCTPAPPPPPVVERLPPFRGHPVAARVTTRRETWIATRGGGAFVLPGGDETRAVSVGGRGAVPRSFVHAAATFSGSLWLGTFEEGLYRIALDGKGALPSVLADAAARVAAPVRLVNRIVATGGSSPALYVGASEGLFVSRDGKTFSRVSSVAPAAITGLAATDENLWVATTEALYRLPLSGRGRVEMSVVRPEGTRAIQDLTVDDRGTAWLATEDRGVVRVAPDLGTRAFDRVAGLPSSWFVAVDADGAGGVVATSLRHGTVRITEGGTWEDVPWAPSPWGLGVRHDAQRTCIGTQGGVTCAYADGSYASLADLPDPRVHLVFPVAGSVLVGTEAGLALYAL